VKRHRKSFLSLALTGKILLFAAALAAVLAGTMQPVLAREIRLGGTNAPGGAVPPPVKLPPNVVELPTITVALRKEDGGWNHIRIDAWLAPKDVTTARDMYEKKSTIVERSQDALPGNRGFTTLKSAREGNQAAKDVIREAAEKTLGHPWTGDVLIRNMLVY